jgi:hypothetical protein
MKMEKSTMKTLLSIFSWVLSATLMNGCGGGGVVSLQQNSAPGNASRGTTCSAGWLANVASAPCRGRIKNDPSWMKASGQGTLLYVSDIGNEDVDVFSYPDGKQVGKLTGFSEPNGLCSDAKGDVFVTDADSGDVIEYAHGGIKPIATLSTGGLALDCAVDPITGDLAVTFYTFPNTSGYFFVYKHARGIPTPYSGLYRTWYCTYDGKGDLYIDGFGNSGIVSIGVLPKGASQFTQMNVISQAGWAGGLQWDGTHLALGDQFADKFVPSRPLNAVYRLAPTGSGFFKIIETAPLGDAGDVVQFWLDKKTIIGPDARNGIVGYYAYPKGGNPSQTIKGFYEPVGATLSK